MLTSMLKRDMLRKKSITATLFIFIFLASVLMASGAKMIVELTQSIQHLFTESKAPHVVQMHAGALNDAEIEQWARDNELVEHLQIVEMLNVDGSQLFLREESEQASVMDISFVTQSEQFDYLLNLQSELVQVDDGSIAVPVYYNSQYGLEIGDQVKFDTGRYSATYTISDFVRDAQMNPALVHSKRFVVSEQDFEKLTRVIQEREYLIEFRLHDFSTLKAFTTQFQNSALPQQGPLVDYSLFQLLNGLGDGIIAAVIILISIILNLIAILCIRFTMLATMEEDYREIGVMKAIGMTPNMIKRLYISKYVALALTAGIAGYAASFAVYRLFTQNITLYMGTAPQTVLHALVPLAAIALIFGMIVMFSYIVLRRFNHISAVEAIRSGSTGEAGRSKLKMSIHKNKSLSVPLLLAVQDGWQRMKLFRLLFFVFAISAFIVIVPVNFYNTMNSPSFISYMGIGNSDIRIDLRHTSDIKERYTKLVQTVEQDAAVQSHAALITSQFKIANDEGSYDNLSVETGDLDVFPLEYMEGRAPQTMQEIALSYTNSSELGKSISDSVVLQIEGQDQSFTVSGIYQDITNGGRTAKARFAPNEDNILWYVASLDVRDHSQLDSIMKQYEEQFAPAKVTNLEGYLEQTLGNTVERLQLLVVVGIVIAVFLSLLITALFMKMLIAKDTSEIAILRSIGFSLSNVRVKYLSLMLMILLLAVVTGTICSNTLGESLVGMVMASFGASSIRFVIDPMQAYVWSPLLLFAVVSLTALGSLASIRKTSISRSIAE